MQDSYAKLLESIDSMKNSSKKEMEGLTKEMKSMNQKIDELGYHVC
jgi:peptidoglycan hydrolase CwlO-like protein